MSVVAEKRVTAPTSKHLEFKHLNAERVTNIALDFLRRLGNKGKLRPKRVSIEGELFVVEVDMKKQMATLQIDVSTGEIKEYTIENKAEEASAWAIQPKLMIVVGVVIVLVVVTLKLFNLF